MVPELELEDQKGNNLGTLKIATKKTGQRVVVWETPNDYYDEVYEETTPILNRAKNRYCSHEQVMGIVKFISKHYRSEKEHMRERYPK